MSRLKPQRDTALLQHIFESSVEGIFVINELGVILKANTSCERMFGYDGGELLGLDLETLLPDNFKTKHKTYPNAYVKKPEAHTKGFELNLWGLKKDGQQFPLDISLTATIINENLVTIAHVKDATRRKKDLSLIEISNAVLTEMNRKYSALIANLQGIVYRCQNDREWTMEYISEGCEKITGYNPKEFLEERVHFSNLIFKEDQQKVWDNTQKSINNKKPYTNHFRIRDKMGNVKYLLELGQGIFDDNGLLIALEGFISDVTQQKKVEEELRQNEAKNRALLEAIPDMMFIQDFKGNYLDFYAPESEKLLITKENIIGKNMKDMLPFEVNAALKKVHRSVKDDKVPQIVEYTLAVNDESKIYEGRAVPFNKHGILTIVRDISEKRKIEQALQKSEAKNREMLEAMPDVIILNDKKGKILELHTPDPTLLNAPITELIGKNIRDIVPDTYGMELEREFLRSQSTNTVQLVEARLPSQHGMVDFEIRVVPLENGNSLSILRDVTRTKQVQHNLYIRNRALEAAGNGIVIVDALNPDLPIIYSNHAFSQMTSYTADEALGRNCRFLQNNDKQQKAIQDIRKAIKKKRPYQTLLRNYRKDGSLFYNDLTVTPVCNDIGQITHFIGVQNDVTERMNQELLKDDMRHILEKIANEDELTTIAHTIVETLEKHLNNCMASILLLDQERQRLYKLAAPNLPDKFYKEIEGIKIGGKASSRGSAVFLKQEVLVEDITIDPRWADYKELALEHGVNSCWSFPILSSKKKVLGTLAIYCKRKRKPQKIEREIVTSILSLIGVAIEQHRINVQLIENKKQLELYTQQLEEKVEERTNELKATIQELVETNLKLKDQVQVTKAAENRALASQEMFTAISRNFPKGVIIVYNANFEIVYIDGGEIQRLGFEKDQFAGKGIDSIAVFSKQRTARIKEDIKKTMEGQRLSFEIRFKNKNYAVNSSPLMGHGDEVKWSLFVYNDITKQKQAESSIRNALIREQELNELKSRFISMASHEFRTPLSAISTSAILIDKHIAVGKAEKVKKYIHQIENNIRNLVVILNDFLSLGKLEEGKIQARYEYFELTDFVKNLAYELKPNLKRGQGITINANANSVDVYLDPKLMHHILTNLVSNAIKYSEEGQKIKITIKRTQKYIRLAIKDQGIGIPEKERAQLFQRFFRAENSTNIQGTGLGLHIVKQYTELMGGTVGFESKTDIGSTFWVEFQVGDEVE